jgi:hypothetical protein
MNRAVCLQRPEPSVRDCEITGKGIATTTASSAAAAEESVEAAPSWSWLPALAQAYHEIYTLSQSQHGMIGMRDFYCCVKQLCTLLRTSGDSLTPDLLNAVLARNFNAKPQLFAIVLRVFHQRCFSQSVQGAVPNVRSLITANMVDKSARNLMLLTQNPAAASELLTSANVFDMHNAAVVIGSEFPGDRTEM